MGVEGTRRMIRIAGAPAAPGLAQGRLHRPGARRRAERRPGAPADERAALARAIASARVELEQLAARSGEGEAAGILQFQLALLEDEALTAPAFAAIDTGTAADAAWRGALDEQIADYERAED